MNTKLLQQANILDVNKQIELVEAIWNGIVSRDAAPLLTEPEMTKLDRWLADHLANPDDVIGWDEVKAAALAKIKR
ncbi:MAG: addiction module protein [Chlorobium sp.]